MFCANVTIKLQTSKGIDTLKPGEVFKSGDPSLKTLLEQGIISPFCYWLDTVVESCPVVCIDRSSTCTHWEEWLEIRFQEGNSNE